MNDSARQRLFDFRHAFDDRTVVLLSVVIATIFLVAVIAIALLAASGRLKPDLMRELVRRTLAWAVMVPLVIGPILLGAFWTILLFTALSLLCYREFARATGFFRDKTMSALIVLGILVVNFAA